MFVMRFTDSLLFSRQEVIAVDNRRLIKARIIYIFEYFKKYENETGIGLWICSKRRRIFRRNNRVLGKMKSERT